MGDRFRKSVNKWQITFSSFYKKYQVRRDNIIYEEFEDLEDVVRWCKEH